MKQAHDLAELDAQLAELEHPITVVMTMGALHEGHASLFELAHSFNGSVVATIFVNPTQFGPGEDFATYPRTIEGDLLVCEKRGVDVVFTPTVEQMYPEGPASTVHAGALGEGLEGASRPGHFDGMATIVTRLAVLTHADVAIFGEKDYQQLAIVRELLTARGVQVVGAPTIREADGLAMSSRNRYLSAHERAVAAAIPRALRAAQGEGDAEAMLAAAHAVLRLEPELQLEYLDVRSPELGPVSGSGPARILIAARIGSTRLIDNMEVTIR